MPLANARIQRIETEVWATPRPGMSLNTLKQKMGTLGNQVLETDTRNNRVKILYAVQEAV